jgi:hypothetical protein
MSRTPLITRAAGVLALAAGCGAAQAGEVYSNIGLPGVMFGYAQPVNSFFGVRADLATIGESKGQRLEDGINYEGKLRLDRAAFLMDWFPFEGRFRFTGGVTANQYKLDLLATGAGGSLTIGNTTYTTTANDRFTVAVKFPTSTPYLGFGWGHNAGSRLRFSVDVGAMIGRAKVSYLLTGPVAQQVTQQDIDAELAELRDGVGKVRAVPQITFGAGWSF